MENRALDTPLFGHVYDFNYRPHSHIDEGLLPTIAKDNRMEGEKPSKNVNGLGNIRENNGLTANDSTKVNVGSIKEHTHPKEKQNATLPRKIDPLSQLEYPYRASLFLFRFGLGTWATTKHGRVIRRIIVAWNVASPLSFLGKWIVTTRQRNLVRNRTRWNWKKHLPLLKENITRNRMVNRNLARFLFRNLL